MKNQLIITTLITALVAGGGGFFAGLKYQQAKLPNLAGRFTSGQDLPGQFRGAGDIGGPRRLGNNGRADFRPVNGQITSQDNTSITVSLADGSSKIILITDKTAINKTETGSTTDLEVGGQVMVFGTENSDGSLTAQNIQLGGLNLPDSLQN